MKLSEWRSEKIMIKLQGKLINVFKTEAGTNAKGEEYEAKDKVQILGELVLPNGDIKNELIDLSVDNISSFSPFLGKEILVDIGCFSSGKSIVFYTRKNAKPLVVEN